MRIPGFMLLLSGWLLALASLGMLKAPAPRAAFVLVAVAVELLGLVFVFRSHIPPKERPRPVYRNTGSGPASRMTGSGSAGPAGRITGSGGTPGLGKRG